ncbi:unnamed protein product, partial [Ectocarpus sp. 8 AP-2014]
TAVAPVAVVGAGGEPLLRVLLRCRETPSSRTIVQKSSNLQQRGSIAEVPPRRVVEELVPPATFRPGWEQKFDFTSDEERDGWILLETKIKARPVRGMRTNSCVAFFPCSPGWCFHNLTGWCKDRHPQHKRDEKCTPAYAQEHFDTAD